MHALAAPRHAARLPSLPLPSAQARVWTVLGELGLQSVAATRVGGPEGRGVSSGERRRVTIAQQLVSDPAALVLGERV